MGRWEAYRYEKFIRSGFATWEANKFKTERLGDPAIKALIKDRREVIREARRAGLTRRQAQRQISVGYRVEGITTARGFQPGKLLAIYRARPEVRTATERLSFLESGTRERYNTLKNAGFSTLEARRLARMSHVNPENRSATFKSKTWQAAVTNHRKRIEGRVSRIAKQRRISYIAALRIYLRRQDEKVMRKAVDPYEWIKLEYKPARKVRDYIPSARRRALEH